MVVIFILSIMILTMFFQGDRKSHLRGMIQLVFLASIIISREISQYDDSAKNLTQGIFVVVIVMTLMISVVMRRRDND